ncbi:nitroreductase family deazaflavin-dependent oxidoreductase [Rhodococcus sp. NPDC057529]|uniref:nitroreductase family deazaflavin-dependent oxidoreductase n=1 Tax=Rhodococcus sp. NPDC057529 TaxID=3346158 RepID=UPI00366E3D25
MTTLDGVYEPPVWDWVRNQVDRFEISNGLDGNCYQDNPQWPIVVITSLGAKSGKIRKSPVMRVEKDGVYAAVASRGGDPVNPTWYYNFLANPEVDLQDKDVKHRYRARLANDEERALWWERAVKVYEPYSEYAEKTDRVIPIFLLERA